MIRIVSLVAALCGPPAVAEEMTCADRGRLQEALETRYGEVSVGYGLEDRNGVVEVYVSASGSWTLLVTRADGTSCVIGTGTSWVFVEQPWPNMDEEG